MVNGGWFWRGQIIARAFAVRHAGFLTELDVFTPGEWNLGPVVRDFWRPLGIGWAVGTAIPIPTGENVLLFMTQWTERGPFERAAIQRLDELRPHLARSVLISARLQLERARIASKRWPLSASRRLYSMSTATSLPATRSPMALATMFNGGRLTAYRSKTKPTIDTATNKVVATLPAGGVGITVSPDGEFVYTTTFGLQRGMGQVLAINTLTNKVIAIIRAGDFPDAVAVSPDGRRIYATNDFENGPCEMGCIGSVYEISATTRKVIRFDGDVGWSQAVAAPQTGSSGSCQPSAT